jgi:hypothetical protein
VTVALLAVPAVADAYRKATKSERVELRQAERGPYGDGSNEDSYGWYVSTRRKGWAVNCVDRPGYSNTVWGRSFVKRRGEWESFSSFNTGNVDEHREDEDYPRDVYADLLNAVRACANRIGATVHGADDE